MRFLKVLPVAAILAGVPANFAESATVFVNNIALMNGGSQQVTFDEFSVGDPIGPASTAVPSKGVTLSSSREFRVGNIAGSPNEVAGLYEGNIIFQPTGSIAAGSFFVDFASPVAEAGLGLFNNFGATERFYNVSAYDTNGNLLAQQLNVGVIAQAEFLGFVSSSAVISRFELNFGPTSGTGQRPLIDSITYFGGSTTTPVPVPAGLPLLLAGIGILTLIGRRRQHPVTQAAVC